MNLDHQALIEETIRLKHTAVLALRRHAQLYAPNVEAREVDALCSAVGEITVHEAIEALNKLQEAATPRVLAVDLASTRDQTAWRCACGFVTNDAEDARRHMLSATHQWKAPR